MTITIDEHNYVHFRVIAIATTRTATPEIREIATVDAIWERDECSFDSAELRQFSTSADEDENGLPACNPWHRTDVVWEPMPSVIVVHDGPTARLAIPRELTGQLPWIDTYRIARVLWPGLWRPQYELGKLVERLELSPFVDAHMSDTATRSTAAWSAVATAALLMAQMLLASGQKSSLSPQDKRLVGCLPSVAAPDWMLELADISRKPVPPLRELPAPWDDDSEWASFGDEDLAWAMADERSVCSRSALLREIERRRRHEEDRPFPLILCRQGSSRDG